MKGWHALDKQRRTGSEVEKRGESRFGSGNGCAIGVEGLGAAGVVGDADVVAVAIKTADIAGEVAGVTKLNK